MEIICPPNSWSKTHSTMMESNSIPTQQVSVLEVKSRGKRKTGQLTDLPARIAELATSCQTCKHTSSSEQSAQTSAATSNHMLMPHRRRAQKLFKVTQLSTSKIHALVYPSQIFMPAMNAHPPEGKTQRTILQLCLGGEKQARYEPHLHCLRPFSYPLLAGAPLEN